MRSTVRTSLSIALTLFAISRLACSKSDSDNKAPAGSETPQPPGVEASRDGGVVTAESTPQNNEGDAGEPEPQGPPSVQFVGRFDTRNSAGPRCGWPGCRVLARFDGTSVSARFDEVVENWMEGGPSEWDLAIDGVWQPKLVMALGTKEYVLATSLPKGVHVVELYKRSEAQNGTTQFFGFDFKGGTLLAPPARKKRRIEMIGDSQPAAFGVEGVGHGPMCPGLNYAAKWQNFRKSFAAVLGQKFNAEVMGSVYSGKGLVKDIWRPDDQTMPLCFPRALPVDPESPWDFTVDIPHVVIIMIGGNDFAIGQPADDGAPTLAQFTDAYDKFVTSIRAKYPAAAIILSASPSTDDHQPEGRATRTNVLGGIEGVLARRHGAGDDKVYAYHPAIAQPSELTGCEGHGSPEFHQRVADEYVPIVHQAVGW
jgi:lysophospholipase L1-like esterase